MKISRIRRKQNTDADFVIQEIPIQSKAKNFVKKETPMLRTS